MSKQPIVHIKNWGISRAHPLSDKPWALSGQVLDHPRFEPDTQVTTSSILYPAAQDLSKCGDGDEIRTRNTTYILVGDNINGSN